LQRHAPGARIQWVRPEAMHLTLKFLGNVDEALLPEIERVMGEAAKGSRAFSLDVAGLGAFPDARAPRVLWTGLSGKADVLVDLAAGLDHRLERLGFSPEKKPLQPHLTLGRIKDRVREVGRALADTGVIQQSDRVGSLDVSALSLMQSDLQPSGAVYTRLAEVKLGER
jgi:RNA 2',3'-cyclic 3'-phosphodiesterase